jgi:hypothetical protein
MTNEQLQKLKRFIKFTNVIEMIPVDINNWPEKLASKKIRGKDRRFTDSELGLIESALLAIAHTIIENSKD